MLVDEINNAQVFIIGAYPDHKNQNNKTFSEESNNLLSKMLKSINLNTLLENGIFN